jgi:hypothetical protein
MTISNIAAAWTNIALNATLTASSEAASMLVTKLQQEDTKRNWRTGAATTANVIGAYAANQTADTFFKANTNLTAAGIVRVRLFTNSTDAGAGTNALYDSNPGGTAGIVDPDYKDAVVLAPSVQSGWKVFRWDLTDTNLSYIEAGFEFASTKMQFAYNYDYGAQRTIVDPSIQKKTKGGQTKVMARPKFKRWELPIGFVTELQRWSVVERIDLLNGIGVPVLFILDPSSTNLGRDSIFGLIQESSPVVAIQGFDSAGGSMSSRSFRVDQRL